jgi:uncharacterized protein (TIGR00288 family)
MNIALLIDSENASPKSIDGVMSDLAERGRVTVRRAYGNWQSLGGWEKKLQPFAIQPIQQFAYTQQKNAADIALAIDAIELALTEEIDSFAIVSSDSDFTPLIIRLVAKGKLVIGFGEEKAPEAFKRACTTFIHTDSFQEPTDESPVVQQPRRQTQNELRGDTALMNAIRAAIAAFADREGWAPMQKMGHHISNSTSMSPKNYGFTQWVDVVRATSYFEEEKREGNHSYFRNKAK